MRVDGKVAVGRSRREEVEAVFPVGEIEGKDQVPVGDDDFLCAPCDEGDEEQAAVPATLPAVYQPTHSEYLDHCVTHYPFRAWCRHCLEGRGREFGHEARGEKDLRAMPVISFDYAFISDRGEVKTLSDFTEAGEAAAKVLVIRDSRSKSVFAHIVPSKGVDEKGFAVKALVDDVKWLGYTRLTLKSDNEPAIVKLLAEALRDLRIQGLEQTLEEHSPEYDPQANGSAEVGVRLLKGHLRTLRSCLESRLGFRVPVRHAVMSWLVRHAAALVTWCAKGHDGQTAYQRVRGREFRTKLLSFGECCSFKVRSQEPVAAVDNRRFHQGIFVGVDRRTGQYMLFSDGEVRLARTVVRVPEADKWNKDKLAAVNVTPLDMHRPREPEVVFKEKAEVEQQQFGEKTQLARQVYLRPADFDAHGFTRGCPRCDHYRRSNVWGTRPHSSACRARITEELSKTVAGRIRIGAAAERIDRTVGELGQQHRGDLPQGEIEPLLVQPHPDVVVDPAPSNFQSEFLPMDDQHESGEVPPPAEEPGVGETRGQSAEDGAMFGQDGPAADPQEAHGDAMDLNLVDGMLGRSPVEADRPCQDPELRHSLVAAECQQEDHETEFKELMATLQRDERAQVEEANREILAVVRSLGGDRGKYKRERARALRAVVSEVYSPPRVTAASKLLPELKLIPGFALDLTTADDDGSSWDFDSKVMRDRAMKKLKEEKPLLLVGSPMCTAFSTWQRINAKIRDPYVVECERRRAVMHLEFCIELYREQLRIGRYFIHEHPAYATSWQEECIRKLLGESGVETATCDQCMYGCETSDGHPIKKPTTFMTNAPELAKELRTRCSGKSGACSRASGGQHAQCRGKIARQAAVYHFKLCRAILVGFRAQLRKDGTCTDGFVGILESRMECDRLPVYKLTDVDGAVLHVQVEGEPVFRDDLTGQLLPPDLVRAARAKELE